MYRSNRILELGSYSTNPISKQDPSSLLLARKEVNS